MKRRNEDSRFGSLIDIPALEYAETLTGDECRALERDLRKLQRGDGISVVTTRLLRASLARQSQLRVMKNDAISTLHADDGNDFIVGHYSR